MTGDPFVEGLATGVVRYQACLACGLAQTLARDHCARCASPALVWRDAAGDGRVRAVTIVHRAPTEAFRAIVPYTLVLVELAEGPRLMGHAGPGALIGDAVCATVASIAGRNLVMFVAKAGSGLP